MGGLHQRECLHKRNSLHKRGLYQNKSGQAAGAAVLLAIIAAVIVAYIILIPPQARQELLGENAAGTIGSSGTSGAVKGAAGNLMTVSPGRVDYLSQKELEHTLPDISLYTKTESKVLAEKGAISAKKSVFSEKKSSFAFSVSDLARTENLYLAFTPKVADGAMIMYVNGEEFFNGKINLKNPKPFSLSKSVLKEENVVEFAVASPGLAFWSTNELSLEDVRVIGDVTSVEAQETKSIFSVSDVEKKNMEKALLKFLLECDALNAGKLMILLNGNEVYEGVPDCAQPKLTFEISPSSFYDGQNTLLFRVEKGNYVLTHPSVKSMLKEVVFPTYYFQLSLEQFQEVKNLKKKVYLTADFVDVVESKTGDFVVNAHTVPFNTKEGKLAVDITNNIVQGNNAVMIKPKKTLEIRELKADFVNT